MSITQVEDMLRAGKVDEAVKTMQEHLRRYPDDVSVLMRLAGVAANVGAVPQALSALRKVVQVAPKHGYAWFGIADLEASRGNNAEADVCYRRAGHLLESEPGIPYNHGVLLERMGETDQAIEAYREAIIRRNDFAQAHNNVGSLLLNKGEKALATRHFTAALRADPGLVEAIYNLGLVAEHDRDHVTAESRYRDVILRSADHYGASIGLARVLTYGDPAQRAEALRLCDAAIAREPGNAGAHHAKGVLLERNREFVKAAEAFQAAWHASGGTMYEALWHLVLALHKAGQYRGALGALKDLAAVQPLDASQRLTLTNLHLQFCEWDTLAADISALREAIGQKQRLGEISPALALSVPGLTEPEMHVISAAFARQRADELKVSEQVHDAGRDGDSPGPLRIGYLSSDFHEHATSYLLAGVLEQHDPQEVRVFAYSYGPDEESSARDRIRTACTGAFRDIASVDDAAAARLMREDGIDILIDLKGWTSGARHEILLHDPAPIKVNWLGYPGSMGDRVFADYILGDPIVTPVESQACFSETLALMPHCYQPNDDKRQRGNARPRAELGLPESGVVFCSFNQNYKITPDILDLWCRLLTEVDGSVLWLLDPADEAKANLLREAQSRGIGAERLVFAPFMPATEHLGRLQAADIALDTAPYNSHTTAADALWSGVPVVCFRGDRFAGRVAASIVSAAGLNELVGESPEDYYRIALELAKDPLRLQAVKARLADAREQCPLFDTPGFARDLEGVYRRMWEAHRSGKREAILPD